MNIRKPLAKIILQLFKPGVLEHFKTIRKIEENRDKIETFHEERLSALIEHCYKKVPFYKEILQEYEVVKADDFGQPRIYLDHFSNLPVLKKEQVRGNFDDLQAADNTSRKVYRNSSGGSTGKPVVFVQDEVYRTWNWANKLYYTSMAGKELGDPEIKLWGSRRDIEKGSVGLKNSILNFIINRTLLNSFRMSEEGIQRFFKRWNRVKPVLVWAYVESIYELAKYKQQNTLDVFSPQVIITTAGTLDEDLRNYIEETFDCDVLNQYGSREEGAIACECLEKDGLHIFEHSHYVEVVDENNQPVKDKHGSIIVTNLHNYSMPLLRYSLEDTGIMSDTVCDCGRELKMLEKVTGRKSNHFVNEKGEIIHGMYFTHMFYFRSWVKKFKVIQEDLKQIKIMMETYQDPDPSELTEIRHRVREVMGEDCQVIFTFHDRLEPSASGKYLFTESKIRQKIT